MNKQIMCVLCPNSCYLKIEYNEQTKEIISLKANKCKRGLGFAQQEITQPLRTLTFSVLIDGGELPLLSTRSTEPIQLTQLQKTAEQLKKLRLAAPVNCGDIIYEDENCKIIATKNISKIK